MNSGIINATLESINWINIIKDIKKVNEMVDIFYEKFYYIIDKLFLRKLKVIALMSHGVDTELIQAV